MTHLPTKKTRLENWQHQERPFEFVLQLLNVPPNYSCARIFVIKNMNVLDTIHKERYPDQTKKCFIDEVRLRMTLVDDDQVRIDDDEF